MMKTGIVTALCVICGAWSVITYARASYKYDSQIGSYWTLADRSSTIPAKAANIDKFVSALESAHLSGKHNALLFPNPENSFDANMQALKTLQGRLREIERMDVSSFQYQSAIQQITAQEQGEAEPMLRIFWGVWLKENHFILWDYMGLFWGLVLISAPFITFIYTEGS